MSTLRPGDGHLHYIDGSHRWPGPDEADFAKRTEEVRAHVAKHREHLGDAPVTPSARDHPQTYYPAAARALAASSRRAP